MNCIEKLIELTKECEPCIWYGKIIEFEELPEKEKYNFDNYEEDMDYIVYCEKCKIYKLIQSD